MSTALTHDDIVNAVRDLPSPALVVAELLRSFDEPEVSLQELGEQIARDQSLAARTLRLSNSSFYGLQSSVRTIPQAIAVLGFDSVRSLVVSAGVLDPFSQAGSAARPFWRHAVATGLAARSIAKGCGRNPEFAFVAGLLHDVGVLVLLTKFSAQYTETLAWCGANDSDLALAERSVLGLDHTTVGRILAQQWKFPLPLQRAIANHHAPMADDLGDMPAIVHVANAVVHALDLAGVDDELAVAPQKKAWDSVRLDAAGLQRVLRETDSQFEDACQILAA